jgi:hypothetical protein
MPGPPLPPSPDPMRHRADPLPSFFPHRPTPQAPSKATSLRPRSPSSPFFFSICSTRRCLPAPHRACPRRPPVTSPPHHRRRRFSTSSVSRSSVRHGSQLACTSPSPFSSNTAGPHHRRHPSPERLHHHWTSPRRLRSTPARRAAARESHRRCHLISHVAAAPTVLTPPLPRHLIRRSTWTNHATLP